MTISIPNNKRVEYEILYSFPFKSETKRMGIVLRKKVDAEEEEHEKRRSEIVFYLKGADSVMRDFVQNRQKKGFIDE